MYYLEPLDSSINMYVAVYLVLLVTPAQSLIFLPTVT